MRETCAHILFCHAFLLAPSHTRIPIAHCCQFRIRASDCAPLTCHASQKKSRPSQKCMRAFEPASLLCQSRHATAVTPIKEKIIGTKKTAHACGRHSRTLCSMATVHEFTMRNASAHKMRSTIASVGVKQKYRLLRRGLPQLCKTFNPLHAKKWCTHTHTYHVVLQSVSIKLPEKVIEKTLIMHNAGRTRSTLPTLLSKRKSI